MRWREMRTISVAKVCASVSVMLAVLAVPMVAQSAAGQRSAGTVKSTSATGLTLTTTAGQDVVVTIPDAVKVLVVAPGSKDLKAICSL